MGRGASSSYDELSNVMLLPMNEYDAGEVLEATFDMRHDANQAITVCRLTYYSV